MIDRSRIAQQMMAEFQKKRPLVYISGPLTNGGQDVSGVTKNVTAACRTASKLWSEGFLPIVPHLTVLWDKVAPQPYPTWLKIDAAWLAHADAVLRLPGASVGANLETALAQRIGVPVFTTWDELMMHFRKRKPQHEENPSPAERRKTDAI